MTRHSEPRNRAGGRKAIAGLFIAVLLLAGAAQAKHVHPEAYYQKLWCDAHNGKAVTVQGKEIDCLTDTYAIEVEFAGFKHYEAMGQALRYMRLSGRKRGGILFIVGHGKMRFVDETIRDISYHQLPIDVWTVEE